MALSDNQIIALENHLIQKYYDVLDQSEISWYEYLNEETLAKLEYCGCLNWNIIMEVNVALTESIVKRFIKYIDFSKYINLSMTDEFILKNGNNMNSNNITTFICKYKCGNDVVVKYADVVDWTVLCDKIKLSLQTIREFKDKVNWAIVSYYDDLDEEFLLEFADKLDWSIVSYFYRTENFKLLKWIKKENNWLYMPIEEKIQNAKQFYNVYDIDGVYYIDCYTLVNGFCDSTNADNEIFVIDEDLKIQFDKQNNTLTSSYCPFNSKFCFKSPKFIKYDKFICYQNSDILHDMYGTSGYGYNIIKVRVPLKACCVTEFYDYCSSTRIGCVYATEMTFDSVVF